MGGILPSRAGLQPGGRVHDFKYEGETLPRRSSLRRALFQIISRLTIRINKATMPIIPRQH